MAWLSLAAFVQAVARVSCMSNDDLSEAEMNCPLNPCPASVPFRFWSRSESQNGGHTLVTWYTEYRSMAKEDRP